jgi:large subunit ribosomal protein L19
LKNRRSNLLLKTPGSNLLQWPSTAARRAISFSPGDFVVVHEVTYDADRKVTKPFAGIVVAKRNSGLRSAFVVRELSSTEEERTFRTHSPFIKSIDVVAVRGSQAEEKLASYLNKMSKRMLERMDESHSKIENAIVRVTAGV